MLKKLGKIGHTILIIFIVVIGGLLIFSMVPIEGNFQTKIVLSGSMEPNIRTGSIVVIKPTGTLGIGDVITFGEDTRKNIPTTHRIVDVREEGGEKFFTTKGDANDSNDNEEVKESEVIGKVLFDVPYAGFIIDLARKPWGFAVLIGIPALVIVSDEIAKIWKEIKKMRYKKEENLEIENG
jgi:signal peptidase I